jgi:hypothetical protein
MEYNQKIGMDIENYSRENIDQSLNEYGEFMYHAELIKRGHWDIHYMDLQTMKEEYRQIIMDITKVDFDSYEIASKMLSGGYDG